MKILYLSHCVGRNGSTIALLNLVREMKRFGHEIGVIIPEKDNYLFKELENIGVKLFYAKRYPMIMCYPDFNTNVYKRIRRCVSLLLEVIAYRKANNYVYSIIKDFKPDIVHTNTSAVDYAFQACKRLNIPHVYHIRELLDTWSGYKIFPSKQSFIKKLNSKNNYNIAVTKAVFEGRNLRRGIDRVIYDGVINEDKYEKEKQPSFDYPYFLSVGYCTPVKGYLQLIEQFGEFTTINDDVHLVIAGYYAETPYYMLCKECIERIGIENRVHFIGIRADVYSLMKSAIALVVASPFEGFGFTIVEAMFNGTLVIGRNTSGIKEQFDKGKADTGEEIGLRFNSDEEMLLLMKQAMVGDFSKMKENARNVVLNNYTANINARAIEDYYGYILGNNLV